MATHKGKSTRARVINSALTLINRRGFNHTSINDIIKATGVKKGNLYFHFTSKEELVVELIKEAKREYIKYLSEKMTSPSPLGKIYDILSAVFELHRSRNFMGGCIFGNMALEISDTNPMLTELIRTVFDQWIEITAGLLHQAQVHGEIRKSIDPQAMARHIVASVEGAIMMARLKKDEKEMLNCIKSIKMLLT